MWVPAHLGLKSTTSDCEVRHVIAKSKISALGYTYSYCLNL
jgi:hypothetical protein